jgi:hypothetical protein
MSDLNLSYQPTYRVVFWGACTLSHDRVDVARRFARRFNIRQLKHLQYLFSGRLVTLKARLSYHEAKRYGEVIRTLGAVCRLEKEANWQTNFAFADEPVRKKSSVADQSLERALSLQPKQAEQSIQKGAMFSARETRLVEHPPMRYQDHQAASQMLGRKR